VHYVVRLDYFWDCGEVAQTLYTHVSKCKNGKKKKKKKTKQKRLGYFCQKRKINPVVSISFVLCYLQPRKYIG
jgi:hypothetical protein